MMMMMPRGMAGGGSAGSMGSTAGGGGGGAVSYSRVAVGSVAAAGGGSGGPPSTAAVAAVSSLGPAGDADEFRVCTLAGRVVSLLRVPLDPSTADGSQVTHAVEHSLALEHGAECCAWTGDASTVVVGDQGGFVHFINRSGAVLFSQRLFAARADVQRTFASAAFACPPSASEANPELIIVSAAGTLLRFSNLCVADLEDAAVTENASMIKTVRAGIQLSKQDLSDRFNAGVIDVAAHWNADSTIIAVAGDGNVVLACLTASHAPKLGGGSSGMTVTAQLTREMVGCGVVRVAISGNGSKLVALGQDGALSVWSLPDLTLIAAWNDTPVTDMRILSSPDAIAPVIVALVNTSGRVRVRAPATCTCPHSVTQQSIIVLHTIGSNLTAVATINDGIPDACLLAAPLLSAGTPNILLIGCANAASGTAIGVHVGALLTRNTVPLVTIGATLPRQQVQALVAAGDMDGAFKWALSHGVSEQEVYKAKVRILAARLASVSDAGDVGDASGALVQEMTGMMKFITDPAFITDVCCSARIPDRSMIPVVLGVAEAAILARMERLGIDYDDNDNDDEVHASSHIPEHDQLRHCHAVVLATRRKWTSYELLSCSDDRFDCQDWHAFRVMSVHQLLARFFENGQVRHAITLWRRHASSNLASQMVPLLVKLPSSVPVDTYVSWLRDEVVPLLGAADCNDLSAWMESRARAIEAREGRPHEALMLCNVLAGRQLDTLPASDLTRSFASVARASVMQQLWSPGTIVSFALSGYEAAIEHRGVFQATAGSPVLPSLARTTAFLRELVYLWDHHNLRMSLSQIEQESAAGIGVALLDRVEDPAQLLAIPDDAGSGHIAKHVRPWAQRHGLEPDALLCDYVRELAGAIDGHDDLLEARCIATIRGIVDPAVRVDATLLLFRSVVAPYSEQLYTLINDALTWSSTRDVELREQKRFMDIHAILARYGVQFYNFSDLVHATMLSQFIVAQTDHPTALQDALYLCKAYSHLHIHDIVSQYAVHAATRPLHGSDLTATVQSAANPLAAVCAARAQFVVSDACCRHRSLNFGDTLVVAQEVVQAFLDLLAAHEDLLRRSESGLAAPEAAQPNAWFSFAESAAAHQGEIPMDGLLSVRFEAACAAATAHEIMVSILEPGAQQLPSTGAGEDFPVLYVVQPGLAHALHTIVRLQSEFGVFISVATLMDKAQCKAMIKSRVQPLLQQQLDAGSSLSTSIEQWQTSGMPAGGLARDVAAVRVSSLFRLSELLGVDREELRALLAQECAIAGDVRSALHWCRDMAQRVAGGGSQQDAAVGATLREVSVCLSAYAAAHPEVFNVRAHTASPLAKLRARAPQHAARLLQEAVTVCQTEDLPHTLSLWKGADMVTAVLAKSEVGEYGQYWEYENEFNEMLLPHRPVADADSWPAAVAYEDWFKETGLVLKTSRAMFLATQSAAAEQTRRMDMDMVAAHLRPNTGVGSSAGIASASQALIAYLKDHGALQLALRSLVGTEVEDERQHTDEVESVLASLLMQVLRSQSMDGGLCLGYMLSMSPRSAHGTFKSVLPTLMHDPARLGKLVRIGMDASWAWQQAEFRVECANLEANARWWQHLSSIGVAVDIKLFLSAEANGRSDALRELVPRILEATHFNLGMALEFCQAYGIPEEYPTLMFIEYLLSHPAAIGVSDYQSLVAAAAMDCPHGPLSLIFEHSISRMDPLDYDRIRFACEFLCRLRPTDAVWHRYIQVLDLLRAFRFEADPEISTSDSAGSSSPAPGASQPLMGFHQLVADPWAVLAPRLTPSSIARLVAFSDALSLPADSFYEQLVHRMVASLLGRPVDSVTLAPVTIADVVEQVRKISDPVRAAVVSRWVADQLPLTKDRLLALEVACDLAAHTDDQSQLIALIQRTHQTAIHLRLLAEVPNPATFVPFLENPQELICQLYHHLAANAARQHMAARAGAAGPTGAELQHLIADIASRFRIELLPVKRLLVQLWIIDETLTPAADSGESQSVFEPSQLELEKERERENELRVIYCLTPLVEPTWEDDGTPRPATVTIEDGARALLNLAFMKQTTKRGYRARARALSAVFQLVDTATLAQLHPAGVKDLANQWQYFQYMAEFEDMHIPQELATLRTCSKPGLVRGLWRDHRHSCRAVRLVANMMLDFGVSDTNLWVAVLRQLRSFGQHRLLLSLLEPLSNMNCFRSSKDMGQIWQEILMQPFREINAKPTRGADLFADAHSAAFGIMEQTILLLLRCPVLQFIDVSAFVQEFRSLGAAFASHAVRCAALLVAPAARASAFRTLLDDGAYVAVLHEHADTVSMLVADGFASADQDADTRLVCEILDRIDATQDYNTLDNTPFLEALAGRLVARQSVNGLLHAMLAHDQIEGAAAVVLRYHAAYPSCESAVASANAAPDDWLTPLKAFVAHDAALSASLDAVLAAHA